MKKLDLFLKLGNFDKKTNSTDIVDVESFRGEYSGLKLGNGGSWCRKSNIHPYKLVTMKRNGKFNFSWDPTEEEKKNIENEFKKYKREPGPQIRYIKICGLHEDTNLKRPIRKDIKVFYKTQPCCVCGSKSELVCDHKNDLYNDPRVLNTNTQTIDDFQSLCTHCNLLKRQIMKDTLKTGKRYGATNIPSLRIFGVDYISGDATFDPKDKNAMKGTYWYDPILFVKTIFEKHN